MSFLFILLISFTQGFTEFLPISSQAHVILVTNFFYFNELTIREVNIIVHSGSLLAIILYNLKQCLFLITSVKSFFRPDLNLHTSLLHNLLISFVPLVFFSYFLLSFLAVNFFESLVVIGISSIIFSIMRLLGYNRRDCVYYSNLLSIPTIFGAIIFLFSGGLENSLTINFDMDFFLLLIFSFLFSLIFIHFLVTWVRKSSLTIFVIYRLIFGVGLIVYSYNFFGLF